MLISKSVAKRRVALLRSLSRPEDAIKALVALLDLSPTDPEAWSELSDLYLASGLYAQAIFSLEEMLLISPNSWNVS
jgi:tetratricopeptide (TPR) repeat protein